MSYPIQPYNPNSAALVDPQYDRAAFNGVMEGPDSDLIGSLFCFANRLMGEMLRNGPNMGGISALMGLDPYNPCAKVFGISAMNVTQVVCGPDGRPHVVQAHDERRVGPGGMWQTKKALRDPNRGIDKMQVGYFVGDCGEIVERRLDPTTGQYVQHTRRHGNIPQDLNFAPDRHVQPPPSIQSPPQLALPPPTVPQQQQQHQPQMYYTQQQQYRPYVQQSRLQSYAQQQRQAPPPSSSYRYL